MKKTLVLIITIILPSFAMAYNGGKQATFNNDTNLEALENLTNYNYLNSEYKSNEAYSNAIKICDASNKTYLPDHSSADANGCYDVAALINNPPGLNYVGNISVTSGDLKNSTNGAVFGHAAAADFLCNQSFTNSRAMRSDDIKYLIQKNQLPALASVLIFDNITSIKEQSTNNYNINAYGSFSVNRTFSSAKTHIYDCNNFSSFSSEYRSSRIRTTGNNAYPVHNINCGNSGHIICVSE